MIPRKCPFCGCESFLEDGDFSVIKRKGPKWADPDIEVILDAVRLICKGCKVDFWIRNPEV